MDLARQSEFTKPSSLKYYVGGSALVITTSLFAFMGISSTVTEDVNHLKSQLQIILTN